ncbi:hypothetical protein CXX84_17505 [Arthrobacter sp. AFG7.2]|uniref:CPBP family intramembrane glutamic endopeptidase n=1 Tax=Arthrobacter sp. AFG7.2 TaxID=1688693 RepID=UPI000C9E1415|nr:hypothetical protein CXX84_17505 [Arthrobacter sp. AFG7.2]
MAGVGEEIFYRYWLQTRAEASLGRWGGIVLATLLFALMHVGSRTSLGLGVEVAAAIVVQGSFGLLLAYLWARYRNIWLAIITHVFANGYGGLPCVDLRRVTYVAPRNWTVLESVAGIGQGHRNQGNTRVSLLIGSLRGNLVPPRPASRNVNRASMR